MGPIESPVRDGGLSSSWLEVGGDFEIVVVGGEVMHNELFLGRAFPQLPAWKWWSDGCPSHWPVSPRSRPPLLPSICWAVHSASWPVSPQHRTNGS